MEKRIRYKQVKFRFTEEEYQMLLNKVKMTDLTLTQYLRKMSLYGIVIKQDLSTLNSLINEINKIGNNINQMARWANSQGKVTQTEIRDVRNRVDEIWQLLKSKLLNPK